MKGRLISFNIAFVKGEDSKQSGFRLIPGMLHIFVRRYTMSFSFEIRKI